MRARGSMDRAVDSGSKGCRFDSYRAHQRRLFKKNISGPLAQLVEHRIFNPGATGSNPVRLIFLSKDRLHKRMARASDGIGRHARLRILWETVRVQISPRPCI